MIDWAAAKQKAEKIDATLGRRTSTAPTNTQPVTLPTAQAARSAMERGVVLLPRSFEKASQDALSRVEAKTADAKARLDALTKERISESGKRPAGAGYEYFNPREHEIEQEIKGIEEQNPSLKKPGFGQWLGKNLEAGLQGVGSGLAATYDFLLPTELIFGEEKDPMSAINRNLRAGAQETTRQADEMSEKKGGLFPAAGKLTQGTVSALPNAALALATGGASIPAQGAQLGAQASGLAATVSSAVKSLVTNPGFLMANAQTLGNSYENAKAGGANEAEATAVAIINSFLSSAVEVGGGIEKLPAELIKDTSESGVRKWVRSMLEEGGEEVVQSIIEGITQKAVYDSEKSVASIEDENAIFNPQRMAGEFAMGAAVGGLLGGAQIGVQKLASMMPGAGSVMGGNAATLPKAVEQAEIGQQKTASTRKTALPRMSMADFTDVSSPVWNNVEYGDTVKQADIQKIAHREMVESGSVVHIPESTVAEVGESFPDLRTMKKVERTPVLRQKMNELKTTLRSVLGGLKGGSYEFEVNGNILEAKLYDTGIREVMEKVNQDKAAMLSHSGDVFQGAQYLYSTPDYDGDPNIYRWNYFYTPVQIGDGETVGVRIAVRDMVPSAGGEMDSQIYNWGIKKDAPLDGGEPGQNPNITGVSSGASSGTTLDGGGRGQDRGSPGVSSVSSYDTTIPQMESSVNIQDMQNPGGIFQPGSGLGDSVGSMKSAFSYQQKDSRVGSNTYSKMYADVLGEMESAGANLSSLSYDVVTEAQSMERAQQRLFSDLEGEIADLPQRDAWSGEDLDTAMGVMDRYLGESKESGDYSKANEWAKLIQEKGTKAGQMIQAFAKYSRTPQGILVDAVSTIDKTKLNPERKNAVLHDVQKSTEALDALEPGDKAGAISLIRDMSVLRRTGDIFQNRLSRQLDAALEGDSFEHLKAVATAQASSIASDYLPKDKGRAAKSWHSMLMLSNVATVMRNLVGNNVFDPVDAWAGSTSMVPLDILLSKVTGTRSVAVDKSWASSAKRQGAVDGMMKSYIETALDVDVDGIESRYGQTSNRTFKMTGNVLERFLSTWSKYQSYALTTTDEFQKGGIQAETQRSADSLKERGLVKDDSLDTKGEEMARYRTFQDDTVASAAMMGLHDIGNLIGVGDTGKTIAGGKVHSYGAGDLLLPFARVPANLVSRAADYSPLGLAKGAGEVVGVLKKANDGTLTASDQAKALNDLGRGLTGSALIASFAALSLVGALRVADDDNDKDVEAMNSAEGAYGTQLNLDAAQRWLSGGDGGWQEGDTLMSIGFLEPINAQMTTGALVAAGIRDGDASILNYLKASADGTIQSLLDLPVMSNLQALTDSYQYSDAETTGGRLADAAIGFGASSATSFLLPNIVRAAAKAGDPYYRDGYSSGTTAGELMDSVKMGIPGVRQTLPVKQTPFGEPKEYGAGDTMNALNSMLLPGALTTYRQGDVSKELQRVREETGANNIYPDRNAPRTIKYGSETYELTQEERQAYQSERGNLSEELMASLISSEWYRKATIDQQAEILSDAVQFANDTAKRSLVEGRGTTYKSTQWEKAYQAVNDGVDFGLYLEYKDRLSDSKENSKTADANAAIRRELMSDRRLTKAQKSVLDEALLSDLVIIPKDVLVDYGDDDSFIITQMSTSAQKKWPGIRDTFGLSAEDYKTAYQTYTDDELTVAERKAKLREIAGGYGAGERLYTAFGKK